jgi:hypothetical protein
MKSCPGKDMGRLTGDETAFLAENMGYHTNMLVQPGRPGVMIAHQAETGNAPSLAALADQLLGFVRHAADQGRPAHDVERAIWDRVLKLGREAFALFLRLHGTGDVGEQLTLPDGSTADRLPTTHARGYRSVFGDFTLTRTCYGTRDGQRIALVPLDNRLQLPASDYSYLLQEWDAALGCESAFARVAATIRDILGVEQPVDSLERNHRRVAASVESFRDTRPVPVPADEGEVFVVSADGKGVPMRRGPDDPPAKAHRGKGDKANKKRMAIVGALYSVDRHTRTAAEVAAALFRDPRSDRGPRPNRPVPVGKHAWGRLSRASDGSLGEPIDAVFGWLTGELGRRNASGRPVVCVMDGQAALWEGRARHVPGAVEVLDILHVTPRLWQAAHLFHREGTPGATAFVRDRVERILGGCVKGVVAGLRRLGTIRGLSGSKKKSLGTICGYLSGNAGRMRYDEYLREGYPIASGVIEGACRHYVKDRLERSGMRWTRAGAQAMLDVRSEFLNGDWTVFQSHRIERETQRMYPHRRVLKGIEWPLVA